jgi:methylenetetrahydrofolate reductase (NADPH)
MAAFPRLSRDYSIEVMPRTAAKVEDFRALLPAGTRVYIAHIDGTEIDDMVATARRLRDEGFEPMPHFPARSIPGPATLADWMRRYQAEAGVTQGLLLGGGIATPRGEYHSSMQLLESGFFDDAGFTHLHVAGHPEGNRDIDPDGGEAEVMAALRWKQDFANRSDALSPSPRSSPSRRAAWWPGPSGWPRRASRCPCIWASRGPRSCRR